MLTKKLKHKDQRGLFSASAFLYWQSAGTMAQKEINGFLSIGRESENLLVLDDDFVSRRHARIEKRSEKGSYLLKDMNSQNGIFLNGARIHQAVLNHNDNIKIGQTQFTFSFERYNQRWKMSSQSRNKEWNETLSRVPHLALSDCPVLIAGPSGTGKELLAQMIHNCSKRHRSHLVSINCSALTENLVESELFGHKRGSYTGSAGDRKGAFLSADQGTLFMDEVGDLPLPLQPKLLRAIEYKEIKPLGSDFPLKTDVRIVSATHQNLKSKIERHEFRKDLYFRLNVVTINVPPLCDRIEDFEPLFNYFCILYGVTFSEEAMNLFKNYHWPGNIRELKNTVERAKALYPSEVLDKDKAFAILDDLESMHKEENGSFRNIEKGSILKALKMYHGNQKRAAWFLDMPRSSLHDKIKKFEIDPNMFKTKK